MHKEMVRYNMRLHGSESTNEDLVETQLSSKLNADQIENNKYLKLVMMTVRLLSKQGLAFRGKTDDDSNFNNVLDTLIQVAGENVIWNKIRNMCHLTCKMR